MMKKAFARAYDYLMAPLEKRFVDRWRRELLKKASGQVLEIGAGTGANFHLYNSQVCDHVIAIEPNPFMIQKAEPKIKKAKVPINLQLGYAEKLNFDDNQFDTIVVTLVLCSVNDPVISINEIKRVLKPNGTLLLLEHVIMNQPYAKLQQMVTPVWKHLCDGCHLDRDTERLLLEGGFHINQKKAYFSGLIISLIASQ